MPVLITDAYSRAWQAFRDVAAEYDLLPFEVRTLVALYESSDRDVCEQEIADRFGVARPAVRRAARRLADRYLLMRVARRPRKVTLRLNAGGILIARGAIERAAR